VKAIPVLIKQALSIHLSMVLAWQGGVMDPEKRHAGAAGNIGTRQLVNAAIWRRNARLYRVEPATSAITAADSARGRLPQRPDGLVLGIGWVGT